MKLFDAYGTTAENDIDIFIVRNLTPQFDENGKRLDTLGYARWPGQYTYRNNIVINSERAASSGDLHLFAHEIGHVLTQGGHYGTDYFGNASYEDYSNLMVIGTNGKPPSYGITSSRRLTLQQETMILNNPDFN